MPSPLLPLLFPSPPRAFRGERWVNILLRSLHLVGIAGIAGGFLFTLDTEAWVAYWYLALLTGVALSLIALWSSLAWLLQWKGLAIVIKVVLLGIALRLPAVRAELFIAMIVLSGLISHAPARIRARYWLRPPRQFAAPPPGPDRVRHDDPVG